MLLDVAEVLAAPHLERATTARVDAGQLEVDQPGEPVVPEEHVGFLVQVVVAHPACMDRNDERVEVVEEVRGQAHGATERDALDPFADQGVGSTAGMLAGNTPEPGECVQRTSLAREEPARDPGRERQRTADRDAAGAVHTIDRGALDATEVVELVEFRHLHRERIVRTLPRSCNETLKIQPLRRSSLAA